MTEFEQLFEKYKALKLSPTKEEYEQLKLEYVYHSNRLEGSNLTLIQTVDVIKHHKAQGEVSLEDMMMAVDHYRALNAAISFGVNRYPLSERILLSLHDTLLKNSFQIDPAYKSWIDSGQELGQFKVKSNRIKTTIRGEEEYFLTPDPDQSREFINDSIVQYGRSTDPFLVKLSKLVQNVYNAHAFFDGNKRMTRLIIANQLTANGYPLLIPHGNQNEYNEALIRGFMDGTHEHILPVMERSFNQQLSVEIDKYNNAKKPNRGFGLII